jgi:hypothetical protein
VFNIFSAKVYQEYVPFKCTVFERLYASNNKGLLSLFEILAIVNDGMIHVQSRLEFKVIHFV